MTEKASHSGSGAGFWSALKHAFAIPKPKELPPQERSYLERLAHEVVRRNLAAPAMFVIETAKPLSFLCSQLVVFFKPLLSAIFTPRQCDVVAGLLSERENVTRVVELIERYKNEESADSSPPPEESSTT